MGAFCDWINIYQVHLSGEVPVVNDGRVFSVDRDGVVKWDIGSKLVHRGSHDTSIRISSDGNRVSLSGNVGRFNRGDNVFNYGVIDTVRKANAILAEFDLPPFTDSNPLFTSNAAGDGITAIATGAVLTEVHLTQNYSTGSAGNASQFIRYMQGFKAGRYEPKPYKSCGVSWGEGSKYHYDILYDKAADYLRHFGIGTKFHDPKIYEFLLHLGVVRHEIKLKSRYLTQKNLNRFVVWGNGMEDKVYALFTDPINASTRVDEYLEIPGRAGELAVAWRDGADLKKRLSKPTFYRYRKELLAYGIDIAIPSNIQRLKTRVEVITLQPLMPPAWYDLPRVA